MEDKKSDFNPPPHPNALINESPLNLVKVKIKLVIPTTLLIIIRSPVHLLGIYPHKESLLLLLISLMLIIMAASRSQE